MSEVVSLRGQPIAHPGNPNQSVIKAVEQLLELAKAGEVVGISYAIEYFDNSTGSAIVGDRSRSLVGRLFGMATEISIKLERPDE